MFLRAGFSQRFNYDADVALATDPGFLSLRASETARARFQATRQASPQSSRHGFAPVAQALPVAAQTLHLGVRAKAVSLGSYVVYWDALWQAPPESPKDGYFAVSLTL